MLGGATASAQDSTPLASNTGLSIHILSSTSTPLFNQAQAFTTGSNATGYRLTSVDLGIIYTQSPAPTFTVRIHADSGTTPGDVVATLTNPASLRMYDPHDVNTPEVSEALSRFTSASGIQLAADTTYWVVIVVSANNANGGLVARTDGNEDAGGAAGWSIADGSKFRNPTDPGPWLPATGLDSYVLYMSLNGFARAASTPPAGDTPPADDTAPPPCPPGTVRVDVETDPTGCQTTNASRFLDWQNRSEDNLCNPGERVGYLNGGNGGPICAYGHEFVNCASGNSEGLTGRRCVDLDAAADAAHREDGSPPPPYSSKYPYNYGLPGCLDVISFNGVWQCR